MSTESHAFDGFSYENPGRGERPVQRFIYGCCDWFGYDGFAGTDYQFGFFTLLQNHFLLSCIGSSVREGGLALALRVWVT
ncbi:hypothetical protein CS542_05215 [Pedobacter sp. IW39]|nr:hypothetical protein CS542_05215 [Pedobacter sp. IW39]